MGPNLGEENGIHSAHGIPQSSVLRISKLSEFWFSAQAKSNEVVFIGGKHSLSSQCARYAHNRKTRPVFKRFNQH